MWEIRDVTPVTHGQTIESRAVFCLSRIRKNYPLHKKFRKGTFLGHPVYMSFASLIIKLLIMVWMIKLLGKLFKPLQSLTSNISRSLWFHLEFLLFRITRNAIFSGNFFMLVSIFSLSYFWRIFLAILAEASLFNIEKSYFVFCSSFPFVALKIWWFWEFVRFSFLDFFSDNSNYLFMLSQKYGRGFYKIRFQSLKFQSCQEWAIF